MSGLVTLLKRRWASPPDPTASFQGQTVIVTGANAGLGFEAAVKFVALGADKVILAVRDLSKGNAAKQEIGRRTRRGNCVQVWQLDMLSYDSIKAFAEQANQLDHLHVAVLNAGVMMGKYVTSVYGWEQTLQVNTLSTVLLALLLLPKLRDSATTTRKTVMECVSSALYKRATFSADAPDSLDDFNQTEDFNAMQQYRLSKLLLLLAMRHLAGAAPPTGATVEYSTVTITSVCPGFCNTGLGRHHPWFVRLFMIPFMFLFSRSTESGARSIIRGVLDGEHGGVWNDGVNEELPFTVVGEQGYKSQEAAWHEILRALQREIPDVMKSIIY